MFLLLLYATVFGAMVVPLIMLGWLLMERRHAARRLARLDTEAPYETRRRAEHEAKQNRNVPTRHIEWRDLASPRAIVPATLATLLALTPPLAPGWSDFGLMIGVVGSAMWWSTLQRSGVAHASTYASAVWCVPAMVWVAVMLATGSTYPMDDYYPWHYQIWHRALTDTVVLALLLAWALILIPSAIYSALRPELSRATVALTLLAVIPLATVVLAGSIAGAVQAALGVGLIGYGMSKSRRRLSDAARARARVDASAQSETGIGVAVLQFNRREIVIGAALVLAVVVGVNALHVFLDIAIFDGDWQSRVALVAAFALVSGLAFMRRGARDALVLGSTITVAAVIALSLQTVGSWILAPLASSESSVDYFVFPWNTYAQVGVLALVGLLIFAWSAAQRRLAEFGAMCIGFAWPIIMAGMLGINVFDGTGFLFTIQAWLPVSIAAPFVIVAMWFVSGREPINAI